MAQKQSHDADVIVVGGGLAGMTMTALLAAYDVSVICLDHDDPANLVKADYDLRTMAISCGSQKILRAAGAWKEAELSPCPIRDIRILHNSSPTLLSLLSQEAESDAFGWVVDSRALRAGLLNRLKHLPAARHLAPVKISDFNIEQNIGHVLLEDGRRLRAPLIIGADGKHSLTRNWMNIPVRRWSYHQQAVVAIIHHDEPHNNKAFEHFRSEGPLAVLPVSDDSQGIHRSALVWTESTRARSSRMAWDADTFRSAVQAILPKEYGRVLHVEPRAAYPLNFSHAYRYTAPRMALIADAAHAIHPIAGQGLNLGLRDVAVLAELTVHAKDNHLDLGSPSLLASYERARRFDNTVMAAATDALDKIFSSKSRTLGVIRSMALKAIPLMPKTKMMIMREAMGAPPRTLPKLMRDEYLR